MTVAFRAGANVVNGTAGTSVTVSKPAGTADGDFLLAFIAEVGVGSITPPAGWTLIGSQANGTDVTLAAYWKPAASEGASWTWTLGASVRNWGWVGAYTGVDTSAPVVTSNSLASSYIAAPADQVGYRAGKIGVLPGYAQVSAVAAVRTASGAASTWTSGITGMPTGAAERFDGSTNAGAGTDITGSACDVVTIALERMDYFEQFVRSQSQTAASTWIVALKPTVTGITTNVLSPKVELEINGAWQDVSAYTRHEQGVTIIKGRQNANSVAAPTSIALSFNNSDGRFTPDNPVGAYYPYLRMGVRLRVSMPYGYAPPTERATAYLASFAPDWDLSTRLAVMHVAAAGRLRRLQRGADPLRPALERSLMGSITAGVEPTAYWTMQDGGGATSAASAVDGQPMTVSGLAFAALSDLAGSDPLPSMATGATLSASIPAHTNTGQWFFGVFFKVPSAVSASTMLFEVEATGTAKIWRAFITTGAPDQIDFIAYNGAGTAILTDSVSMVTESEFYGQWVFVGIDLKTNGADIDYNLGWGGYLAGQAAQGTLASQTHGIVTDFRAAASANLNGAGVGHAFLITDAGYTPEDDFFDLNAASRGHTPESAQARVVRLGDESDEPIQILRDFSVLVSQGSAVGMGAQPKTTLIGAWRECEDADLSLLHDGGIGGDLVWIARQSKQNADIRMTLNKSQGQLAAPFQPVRDDLNLRNDWTISRQGGSSGRYQQLTGPMSVKDPPNGVGRYRDSKALNLSSDSLVTHMAGWRVNEGTARGMRYPAITGDLRMSPELVEAWLNCRIGARVKGTNLMTQHPSSVDIDVFVEGYTEVIAADRWRFSLNVSPAAPYTVGVLDSSTYGRLDSGTSTLASGITSSATSLSVATSSAGDLWATGAGLSIPIVIAGEVMTLTAISGGSSPQTFTVTRSVNGVVKAHSSGDAVNLDQPPALRLAL
ncbi:MAG TPA: hypothetical protein VFC19_49230 [Candidatus Limnocylindrales bacterium]|nr:hypothetical protein [Candidatus Limnocylindrales bacterium]